MEIKMSRDYYIISDTKLKALTGPRPWPLLPFLGRLKVALKTYFDSCGNRVFALLPHQLKFVVLHILLH